MEQIDTKAPRGRRDGWSRARKVKFLHHLAQKGNVRWAAAECGMSAQGAYVLRRREPGFADAWDAALVLAREHAEQVLGARAIDGVEEPIFYRGEQVGVRRRYDTRLLLAHLARLDKIAAETRAGDLAWRFDELLARIAGEEPDEGMIEAPRGEELPEQDGPALLPMERARYAEDRASEARWDTREALVEQAREQMREEAARDPERQHWEQEDFVEMGEDALFDADAHSELLDACEDAATEAREEAGRAWDAWHKRACERIDELARGLPGEPETPDPVLAFRERLLVRAGHGAVTRGLLGPVLPEVPGITPVKPAELAPLDRVNCVNFADHPRSVLRG